MRNITLSADESLIDKARCKAQLQHTTLNAEFRKWLEQYTDSDTKRRVHAYQQLMVDLSDISTGGKKFTRNEMNER